MLFVNIVGLTLLAVFLLFVINKSPRNKIDQLLIVIILVFAAFLAADIWIQNDLSVWSFAFQSLANFYIFFPFLIYALLLIDKDHRIKMKWWWFASYDIIFTIFLLADLFSKDLSQTDIRLLYEDPPLIYHFFYKGHFLYISAIMIWYLNELRKYENKIMDFYSNIEKVRLQWVKYFSWAYLTMNIVSMMVFLPYNFGYIENIEIPFFVINASFVLWLFYLIYNGISHYSLANFKEPSPVNEGSESAESRAKYKTSSLSEQEMDKLFQRICQLFEEGQIFFDPELKVQKLAEQLEVTTHNISQTINSRAGKPFYDFVNDYRIEHLKQLLVDPEKNKFTILALGLESGFNSKATLNRIFKQHSGQTPREYQLAFSQ